MSSIIIEKTKTTKIHTTFVDDMEFNAIKRYENASTFFILLLLLYKSPISRAGLIIIHNNMWLMGLNPVNPGRFPKI